MAMEYSNYMGKFKASKGWFEKFLIRFKSIEKELRNNKYKDS